MGLHGSLDTLFVRIKHKDGLLKKDTSLIGLLTICFECYEEELRFDYPDYKA